MARGAGGFVGALGACESGTPDEPLPSPVASGYPAGQGWRSNRIPKVIPNLIPRVNPQRTCGSAQGNMSAF